MTTELKKTPNTKGIASDTKFWFSLPADVLSLLGRNVILQRHPITKAFVLSKPNIDSMVGTTVISVSNAIRMPIGMVDEWTDLGAYEVDIEHETETVYLIKK